MNRYALTMLGLTLSSLLLLQGCIPVMIAGAGVAGTSIAGNNLPTTVQFDDSALRLKAINALNQYPDLAATSNIEVTVFNKIALLLGQVPDQKTSDEVATAVGQVNGIQMVYNQLTIGPRATFTAFSDDAMITTRVKSNFIGHVNPMNFKVITEQGVVYLLAITTESTGEEAAQIASRTKGVKKVVEAYWYIIPETQS